MIDSKELYQQALDLWGNELQVDMFIQECAEAIKAIVDYRRGRIVAWDVCLELADVQIMLGQMEVIFGHEAIGLAIQGKLERLQKRIKEWEKSQVDKKE